MEENCATGDIEIDKLSDALDSVLEDQKVEAEAGCVAVEPKCQNWTCQSIHKAPNITSFWVPIISVQDL